MLTRILFLVFATLMAVGVSVLTATTVFLIGFVAEVPTPMLIVATSGAALTGFGISIAYFSLAAALFLIPPAASPAPPPQPKARATTRVRTWLTRRCTHLLRAGHSRK